MGLVAVLAVAASLAASGRHANFLWSSVAAPATVDVEVRADDSVQLVPKPRATQGPIRATGYVVASKSAVISSEVTARIVGLPIKEGEMVAAGEVVVRLDDTSLRAELALAMAKAAAIVSREGEMLVEQRLAEEDRDQAVQLSKNGFLSVAALSKMEGRVQSVVERRKTLQADIRAASAEIAKVRALLSKYSITAPISGVVASRSGHVGEVVWTDAATSSGGVMTILGLEDLQVEVDIPEGLLHRLKALDPVRISLDARPGTELRGAVAQVLPTIDRNKATAKVMIGFAVPTPEVRPGMLAHVEFGGGRNGE
jgi:HlyD family secretion protein